VIPGMRIEIAARNSSARKKPVRGEFIRKNWVVGTFLHPHYGLCLALQWFNFNANPRKGKFAPRMHWENKPVRMRRTR
jgi:hypothetical protein